MIRFFLNKFISKSISSILLIAFLFSSFFIPVRAFALTSGPMQPEFGQFAPAGASEMVNLFNGDFSYNIPLMDVEGYPLNISYEAGANMEEEASWVGLGWNINTGAVNRGLRGLPDDFDGDQIKRSVHIADHVSQGGFLGFGVEIAGNNLGLNLGVATGGTYDNYRGFGSQVAFDAALTGNLGKSSGGASGQLTAGVGLDISSNDGANFRGSIGLSASYSKASNSGTSAAGIKLGANYSPSINSRSGVWNQTWSFSASAEYATKGTASTKYEHMYTGSKGAGVGVNFSTTILAASTAYLPQIPFDSKSSMWSVNIKIGGGSCIFAAFGTASGYRSKDKIVNEDKVFNGFGYFNEERGALDTDPILDFSREKDGVMYKESPNMAITSHNYDMFSASGQGFYGSFRAHRNDIGVVYDPSTTSSDDGNAIGAELAFGDGVNIGVNYNGVFSDGNTGKWANTSLSDATDFSVSPTLLTSTNNVDNLEKYHLSFNGEKTPVDAGFYNMIGNKEPVSAGLVRAGSLFGTSLGYNQVGGTISGKQFLNNKKSRNEFVSTLNAEKAQYLAVEKDIKSYPSNTFNLNANGDVTTSIPSINRTSLISYSGSVNQKHISEITTTNTDGSRYVYGIPLYNLFQKEVTFNVSKSCSNSALAPDANNYVSYNAGSDNTKSNGHGRDNYFEANVTPPYAHSYLLTSVLSSDYVDLTSNGPTTDDYGNYVKFNFTKENPYAWRVPVSASDNKAHYNFGSLADLYDDKAGYTYGTKDIWYSHSVETKNFVAEFILDDQLRNDAKGVSYSNDPTIENFNAESSAVDPSASLKRLKEIRLYNKQDLLKNGTLATPIKVVHFEYDYSLCKNVPNNLSGGGKLTLKKIWFTYGNSSKGILSPYEFAYNDQLDHDFLEDSGNDAANPNYNPTQIDRWGIYKQPVAGFPLDNTIFPYTQQSKATQDKYARSWCINTIKTPSGGVIKVDYESDDYAYLMEKRPGQMFSILGYASDANGLPSSPDRDRLYKHFNTYDIVQNYVYIDISNAPSGLFDNLGNPLNYIPGLYSVSDASQYVQDNYLASNGGKLFFKAKIQLTDKADSYEFIPGYADILSATAVKVNGSSNYNAIALAVNTEYTGDSKYGTEKIHPITKAALQYGRKYLNDVIYPYTMPCTTPSPIEMIQQLGGLYSDFAALFGGVNHGLIKKSFCSNSTPGESFVRLTNPNYKKLGGGLRVKQISISDEWNNMVSSEQTHSYTQTYDYTKKESNGKVISSGVANYEPLLGGDENSYRYPVITQYPSNLSVNDELMIENPIGESLLPNANVGYSKVTVQNVYDNTSGTVTAHGTGKTEYEFYTNRDFPYKFSQTGIERQLVEPEGIAKFIKFKSTKRMFVSQGYAVKVNDMHGKSKSVKHYGEGQSMAISGVDYFYKHSGNDLDNNVNVINSNNVISTKEVGVDIDIVNDTRSASHKTESYSISANINTFTCSYYVPLIFIWPGYSKIVDEFYSFGTTKTVQQFGILEETVAFDNNSIVKTRNELYDETTGEVVMTKTNNQYNDPVYDFVYPAHWAYQGMGPAYKNAGTKFYNLVDDNGKNIISAANSILTGGDEVAIYYATSGTVHKEDLNYPATKAWVIKDLAAGSSTYNEYFLIDKNGDRLTGLLSSSNRVYEIIRSGSRNMQNVPIGSATTKKNPQVSNALVFDQTKQIISTSATEFDDKWDLYCPSPLAMDAVTSCTPSPVPNAYYNIYQKIFNCYLTSLQDNTGGTTAGNISDVTIFNGRVTTPTAGLMASPSTACSGITLSELNTLLNLNGFPSASSLIGNTSWVDVLINVTRDASNNLIVKIGLQQWNCTAGCADFISGVTNYGTCNITLTKISGPINNADFPFVYHNQSSNFSNFSTNISGQPNNVFQVNFYNSLPQGNDNHLSSFNGTYQGSVPCIQSVTNMDCSTVSCPVQNTYINPYYENIRGNWKAKRSFSFLENRYQAPTQPSAVMKGDIRDDGYFNSYKPFWNLVSGVWTPIYKLPVQNTDPYGFYNKWVINSELNKADRNGNVLQTQNAIRKPSSAIYGYNFTRSMASAGNALYTDIAFDGFEDYDYVKNGCIEHFKFYQYKPLLSQQQAHTGRFSLKLGAGVNCSVKGSMNGSCNYSDNLSIQYGTGIPTGTGGSSGGGSGSGTTLVDLTQNNYVQRVGSASTGIYQVSDCDCAGRFGPIANKQTAQTYVMSVWVKQLINDVPNVTDYSGVGATFILNGTQLNTTPVKKSKLIDGWQKLDYEFTVPANSATSNWEVQLNNTSGYVVHFDDFRIHPFNSGMVSTVLDPYSLRLWAELDDRNFATFYEYDEEGSLVRVKKETEKGIYTVKEVRSGIKKRP